MNQATNRLVLVLLILNVLMLLFGVCGMAWQASRAAARPLVPTNLAWTPDQRLMPPGQRLAATLD